MTLDQRYLYRGSLSETVRDAWIDSRLRGVPWVLRPSAWFLQMHTEDPGPDGTLGAIGSETQRVPVAWTDPGIENDPGHVTYNVDPVLIPRPVNFPDPGTTNPFIADTVAAYFSVWTDDTPAGFCLARAEMLDNATGLPAPVTVLAGQGLYLAAGSLAFACDVGHLASDVFTIYDGGMA